MDSLISVVVPVYNIKEYLGDCVTSICQQSYRNIEIILVNDGSTDGSEILCEELKKSDPRIRVVHKENGGLSEARNYGTSCAKGAWIIYIDGDDIVSPDLIGYLIELKDTMGADISICELYHCFDKANPMYERETSRRLYESREAICEMLYQRSFLVSACGKLFPTALMKQFPFRFGILFEDSDLMYRLFDQVSKIAYGDAKLYAYMHREGSITTKKFSLRDFDILTISDRMVDYFKDRDIKLIKAARAYQMAGVLRVLLNAPKDMEDVSQIRYAKQLLAINGKKVLADKECRKKTRYGLILYLYFPWCVKFIYKRVNRW